MANLKSVIKISSEDYATLKGGGTITKGGVTYSYDADALYIIDETDPPAYAETAGVANTAVADTGGNNIAATYDKKPLVIEVDDTDTSVPSGTYASITTALAAGRDVLVKVTITTADDDIRYLRLAQDWSEANGTYRFENSWCNGVISSNNTFVFVWSSADNHNHGHITSDGKLQTTDITIANGDKLVVTDASNSNRVTRASLTFDGSTSTQALTKKGTWETFKEKTFIDMTVSGTTLSFWDINNNSLTHAQVVALLQDNTKDVEIRYEDGVYICNFNASDGDYYFSSVQADSKIAKAFLLNFINDSLHATFYDDAYLITDTEKSTWNNKAEKLKNIVIVKSGTSPNYTYSLPSGTTAASIATDITTKGTTVVLSLDNEIYYYDHTTGSSSSTILHFKYTDTTTDGVVEKDLAIAYSNNAVTLTTTEYNEKLLPAVPNNHGDIIFSDLPYLNTGTPLSANFPIADAPADAPFAKCFGAITASKTYTSDYIPVSPNDVISGEIWAYRASGATGTAGSLYCGINRYDRNKKPIQSNSGIDYFVANAISVPIDGVWHRYRGTTTIPTTHTAYNGSDGQGVYFIQLRITANFSSGTIPTYFGGIKLSTTPSAKEIDIINCGTNDVDNYANTENVIRAYHFDGTAPNNMPHADNANAVIDIDTYRGAGNYNHQVGFSGNGGIYHRTRSNTSFSSWKKIGYSTDSINSNDIVLDINTWAVNDEIEKKGFYFSSIHNTLYAANLRYVVTHKIYSSVDDSYLRDAYTSDIFKGSFPSDVNGAARDNEYGVLYIGTKSIDEVTTSGGSNSITTYGQGYIILSFYASHYSPSVTGRVWSGNANRWYDLTFTRHGYTYIANLTSSVVYPKALEITYQGVTYSTAPRGAAVSFVEWYRTRPSLSEFAIVTKYNTPQNLYGNVTAPKFITRGGTSAQFVKGDGTLDSTSTAANSLLSSLPDWTAVPTDTTKLVRRDTGGSASFGQITFLTVWNYINGKAATVYAPLASPALTGTPTAPTAASGTNTTQIATTAFVQAAVSGAGGGGGVQSISCNENDILVSTTTTNTTSTAIWTALQAGKMPLLYSGTSGFSIVIQDMGGGYWSGNGVDATNKKSYNVYGYQGSIVSGVATLMAAASDIKAPLIIPVPDEDDTLTSGTYASITTALAAGRDVILRAYMATEDGQYLYFRLLSDETVNDNGYYFYVQRGQYYWSARIADDESITYYSSRLATYSELTTAVGNIETLLAAI